MTKEKLGIENITDFKVKIYVETAYEIFQQCFVNEELVNKQRMPDYEMIEDRSKFYRLANALNLTYTDNPIPESFLRRKLKEIEDLKNNPLPQTVGFDHFYILTLATFSGNADYMLLNKKYTPALSKQVLFTPKPFGLFSLVRVPQSGFLSEKTGSNWVYTDYANNQISRDVKEVNAFTMPGDRSPLWIEVKCSNQEKFYFSESVNPPIMPVKASDNLVFFFKSKIK
jgi:hypothetical protein